MPSEKAFENQVKKWLTSKGIYQAGTPEQNKKTPQNGWFFKVWGGGFQKSGIPDLILCVNGLFMGVEIKGAEGKPSQLQLKNLDDIHKAGGAGILLYPNTFAEFQELVEGVMECK